MLCDAMTWDTIPSCFLKVLETIDELKNKWSLDEQHRPRPSLSEPDIKPPDIPQTQI
jgi:hypothetical protein